jgi:hypothetical protein
MRFALLRSTGLMGGNSRPLLGFGRFAVAAPMLALPFRHRRHDFIHGVGVGAESFAPAVDMLDVLRVADAILAAARMQRVRACAGTRASAEADSLTVGGGVGHWCVTSRTWLAVLGALSLGAAP